MTDIATSRKKWILGMKSKGFIVVDLGAVKALKSGNSLLAAGVLSINGRFNRGDPINVKDISGNQIAKGLTAYPSVDVERIKGCQSKQLEAILGHPVRSSLIHRDDMVISSS